MPESGEGVQKKAATRWTPKSFIERGQVGRPLTAQPVRWRCFLSPVASSHPAAQVGWKRARCAGPRTPHLGERKGGLAGVGVASAALPQPGHAGALFLTLCLLE